MPVTDWAGGSFGHHRSRERPPTLTRAEVRAVLRELDGVRRLMG